MFVCLGTIIGCYELSLSGFFLPHLGSISPPFFCSKCAKLLVDIDVIHFYPSKFVLITDILDNFGECCAMARTMCNIISSEIVRWYMGVCSWLISLALTMHLYCISMCVCICVICDNFR